MTKFSPEALTFWNKLSLTVQLFLLENVYCTQCKDIVIILNYKGSIDEGDLFLEGVCGRCGSNVYKIVEKQY
jgi:hypothetical protein